MTFKNIAIATAAALAALALSADVARGETAIDDFTPPSYRYQQLAREQTPFDYWHQVAVNAAAIADYPNALAAFDKAIDLAAVIKPRLLEERGWIHYRLGNYNMARQDLNAAAELYRQERRYGAYANTLRMMLFLPS